MHEDLKRRMVKEFEEFREQLQKTPGFFEDPEMRAVYVVLATLESAIAFNELIPLADLCAKFCGDKADEMTLSG